MTPTPGWFTGSSRRSFLTFGSLGLLGWFLFKRWNRVMTIQEEVEELVRRGARDLGRRPAPDPPPGAVDAMIADFEARRGVKVPPELREWLRFTDGPRLGVGNVFAAPMPPSYGDLEESWLPGFLKRGWIPITYKGTGSWFVLATRPEDGLGRPVFAVDRQDQTDMDHPVPTYVGASDLWHFLRFHLRRDAVKGRSPYDREFMLSDDPALADYTKVPHAWELPLTHPRDRLTTIQEGVKTLAREAWKGRRPGTGPELPPGVSDAVINEFQARTGVVVPPELREWLHFTNGPRLGVGGIPGIRTPDPFEDIEGPWFPEWRQRGWIPIGRDVFGNYYALATRPEDGPGRPVFFSDIEQQSETGMGEPSYVCASDLWHFLRFYLREEQLGERRWPFDREFVLANDPALAGYAKVRHPWDLD